MITTVLILKVIAQHIACLEMILASHSVGHCSYKVNKKNRWREKYIYFGSIRVQKGNNFVLNA